jgi:hypothetical protein
MDACPRDPETDNAPPSSRAITSLGVTSKSFRRSGKGGKHQNCTSWARQSFQIDKASKKPSRPPRQLQRAWRRHYQVWRVATLCPTFLTVCAVLFATLAAVLTGQQKQCQLRRRRRQTPTCSYHADFYPDHVRFRDRGYATDAEL